MLPGAYVGEGGASSGAQPELGGEVVGEAYNFVESVGEAYRKEDALRRRALQLTEIIVNAVHRMHARFAERSGRAALPDQPTEPGPVSTASGSANAATSGSCPYRAPAPLK